MFDIVTVWTVSFTLSHRHFNISFFCVCFYCRNLYQEMIMVEHQRKKTVALLSNGNAGVEILHKIIFNIICLLTTFSVTFSVLPFFSLSLSSHKFCFVPKHLQHLSVEWVRFKRVSICTTQKMITERQKWHTKKKNQLYLLDTKK